jgi:hypothetical protein
LRSGAPFGGGDFIIRASDVRTRASVHPSGTVPDADRAAVVVTCVHGTWASGTRWPELEDTLATALAAGGPVAIQYFEWSGRNSVRARARAAIDLRQRLLQQIARTPRARHLLIAHSHGANVVLHAVGGDPGTVITMRAALAGIVLLAPPLLDCTILDRPEASANRLLLAAVTIVPVIVAASAFLRDALDISRVVQLAAVVVTTAIWLRLFRPGAVQRRAHALAGQLALPRFDFPGLIVRASRDEATLALSSAGAFARIARQIWSRVLHLRTPFLRKDARRVHTARGTGPLARALFETVTLVPMSISWLLLVRDSAAGGRWFTVAATLPLAIVLATAAMVIVGGSLVLLLVLPVVSLLLWPFGIAPSAAAALLAVSVERLPTPAWQVVTVLRRDASRWRHSLHRHPAALDAVRNYLQAVLAAR